MIVLDTRFSVLMSVYKNDVPSYLDLSLESICKNQKLLPDEVVLVIDGPLLPELNLVIDRWVKECPALVLVNIAVNHGLAAALNAGLKVCSNEIVFRMDADDISHPDRFGLQLKFMLERPELDVCGSYISEFESTPENIQNDRIVPLEHDDIVTFSKARNPLSHPSVCFRKSSILEVGGYPLIYPEDYFLWVKLIQNGAVFGNIPRSLVSMRVGNDFMKRRGFQFLKGELYIFFYMYRSNYIGTFRLIFNILSRSIVRLAPSFFKTWLYKKVR